MEKKTLPKVSIVIPVYNGSKYMREAINSALAQTYQNIEVIVVNDGSTDDGKTHRIAKSYGDKIKYFKKENGGVSTALNVALKNMTGDYFSWLSHDDVYYPDKIEKQITYLIDSDYLNKNVILYADYDLINNNGALITKCTKDHKMLNEKPEYSLLRGSINGITLLIPKKAFDEVGFFDENLRCVQDYVMWHKMSKRYKILHMEGIVAKSRQHGEQVTNKNPKVLTEGNPLWIDMISSLSVNDMRRLEGSEYNYYNEMAKFLKDSQYDEARIFCEKKYKSIEKNISKTVDDVKVSIVIPFYNRVSDVINAIESVINQTHKNLEILVVNDGSNENIEQINDLIKTDKRMKLINIVKNKGASNARNIGIDNSTGEYIAFLDSDDLFVKEKIKKQLFKMLVTEAKVSHTSYVRKGFDQETTVHSGELDGKAIPKIIYSCGIATPTVMINTKHLNDNNFRYNPELIIGEDTCFWLEILRHENILGIDEPLTIVNVGETSAAYNQKKQILGLKTILTYVLLDKEYKEYDYEIALLCKLYIETINMAISIDSLYVDDLCPNCKKMLNSKSWRVTEPLRLLSKGVRTIKESGLKVTLNKAINKIKQIIKKK